MIHPRHGPNRFKLGIFSANADGGLTLTRVPERCPARWDEVVEVARMADHAGIEFFLPIARWKGLGGEVNSREWSFETSHRSRRARRCHPAHRAVRDRACSNGASSVRAHDGGSCVGRPGWSQHRLWLEPAGVLPLLREAGLRQP